MGRGKRDAVPDMVKPPNLQTQGVERGSEKDALIDGKKSQHDENQVTHTEIDLGLDISTSVVGVCFLDHKSGKLVKLGSVKLNTVNCDNLWKKADRFEKEIGELLVELGVGVVVSRVFVEANAKMFTPGFSSADTILTLAKFNGICSYIMHNLLKQRSTTPGPIIDVNVVSARSRLGIKIDRKDKTKTTKEKVREQLLLLYPNIPIKTHVAKTGKNKGQTVPDKEMEDVLDAFVIVAGGRVLFP